MSRIPNRRLGRTRERRTLVPTPTPIGPVAQPEGFTPEAPATERYVKLLMTREPTPIGPRPDATTRVMNADR